MPQPLDAVFYLKLAGVAGSVLIGLFGLSNVFARLKAMDQGFGPVSVQALGIVLFLPVMVIVSLLTEMKSEAIAALLGTAAGYVLSRNGDNPPAGKTAK